MANFTEYAAIPGVYYAHNCFLQILAETGLFSLLSFILFCGSVLRAAARRYKKSLDFLLLGLFCSLCGYLANSFFDVSLYSVQLAFLFWFLMGLTNAGLSIRPPAAVIDPIR